MPAARSALAALGAASPAGLAGGLPGLATWPHSGIVPEVRTLQQALQAAATTAKSCTLCTIKFRVYRAAKSVMKDS